MPKKIKIFWQATRKIASRNMRARQSLLESLMKELDVDEGEYWRSYLGMDLGHRRSALRPAIPHADSSSEIASIDEQFLMAFRQIASDHAARYEGLPLTSLEDVGDGGEGPSLIETLREETEDEDEQIWKNPKKVLKILFPHFALIGVLLLYTGLGAFIFQLLEDDMEISIRQKKVRKIQHLYQWFANETWTLSQEPDMTLESWGTALSSRLISISKAHEGDEYKYLGNISESGDALRSRWTFPAAVLYALTVLTACGYSYIDPMTNAGKIFAIVFALIGIPLMFITAADIGKFLSEMTLKGWQKGKVCCNFICSKLCCRDMSKSAPSDPNQPETPNDPMNFDPLDDQPNEGLWFPIGAYFTLICLYSALGALLYSSWEHWDFIRAFHFSFNLITTVGLGTIDVANGIYLILIVAYVIIGLAVVTMCVDLASSYLKAYFTKIHYFGRARSRFLGMSEDIREMMQIISAMRKKKGGKVTWNDIKEYLRYEQQLMLRPYAPHHLHMFRYIDETSSAYSGGHLRRQNSMQSDLYSLASHHTRRLSKASSMTRNMSDSVATPVLPPNGNVGFSN